MATTINAGRVRFVSRGTYNNSTQYYLFDLVDYNGSSYIAKENTLGNLPTNTQYWQLIAEKGNTGSTGQTGPVGATGNGIASITKTATVGLVDTYTITYTNGNTTTFTVTNGEDGEVTETELNVLRQKLEDQQKVINQLPQVEGQGTEVTLQDTIEAQFTKFDVEGNSVQDGTPSPDNEVPILSSGENGSINEKILNKNLFVIKNYSKSGWIVTIDNPLKGMPTGDYTISCQNKSSINAGIRTYFSNEPSGAVIGNLFTDFQFGNTIMFRKDTLTQEQLNAKYYILYFNNASGSQSVLEDMKIMIEPGSTATPYVEHKEQDYPIFVQQPRRSIGDVRDKFVKKSDGKWYERHYILRKIFDGTEEWGQNGSTASTGQYVIATTDKKYGILNLLSNSFVTKQTSTENSIAGRAINRNIYITIDLSIVEFSVAKFKAYLAEKYASGKSVYVDYELEEPLDLPCTPEQVEQLENKPSTYKEMTIINSQDETEAYLEVSGIYDLNNIINN